ncbi:MAG: hypothetical protein ABI391_07030 [Hyphomicrobiaceae bacterium]
MTEPDSDTPKDVRQRHKFKIQHSRLGKTWQDRGWRQKLLGQTSTVPFSTLVAGRATSRRALPSRH